MHAAGVTKCLHSSDFFKVNTEGTANLALALRRQNTGLRRFVYLSSLSVMGPAREQEPHTEITAADEARPDTAYGKSKLESEQRLEAIKGFPFIVLRPTGVYGPREKDYFMMAQSISRHVDFAVGYRPQHLTFIYVMDVVQAVFLALDHGTVGSRYFISDGRVYSSRTFSDLISNELGNPWLLRIKAPLWLLRIISFAGEWTARITGKISALNNDKYNIMKQRNWMCDIKPAENELGYKPQYDLKRGVAATINGIKTTDGCKGNYKDNWIDENNGTNEKNEINETDERNVAHGSHKSYKSHQPHIPNLYRSLPSPLPPLTIS